MNNPEVQQILKRLDDMEKERTEKHELLMTELANLKLQIAPISDIYMSAKGFGSVVVWFAKWIITPLIVLGGGLLTYKDLHK